jgi:predicted enzyme related to lactoylglutathione lyase
MSVAWFDIQVPDLEAAKSFYGAVFGWTFTPFGETFVTITTPDGNMIGGMDQVTGEPAGRQVRIYLATDELEGVLSRVEKAGGTVDTGRTLITEEYGWSATLVDPSGLKIGLWTSKPA